MFKRKNRERADPGDDLVEVARLGVVEAELVAGKLREAGMKVAVLGNEVGGGYPQLWHAEGARIMVRRRDAEAAGSVLSQT
jgi:hypothetical protein